MDCDLLNKLSEHLRKIKLDTKSFENRLLENLEKKTASLQIASKLKYLQSE